jgi:ribosomal protein S18 acetylase RimI-like enzyme
VVNLDDGRVTEAIGVLVPAFLDDPIFTHHVPDRDKRARVFELFFNDVIRGQLRAKTAFAIEEGNAILAVAVWMSPQPTEPDEADRERGDLTVRQLQALDAKATSAILGGFEGLQAFHPQVPHWYLMFVGVRPQLQRQGLGRQLLDHVHRLADRTGTPCYLETPFAETRAFYGSLGYSVTNEMRAFGDAPPLWTMLRSPGTAPNS